MKIEIPKPIILEIISETINDQPYEHEWPLDYVQEQKGGNKNISMNNIENIIMNDTELKKIFDTITNN